jgi:thiaminase/transcriptional activator TenA
MKEKKISQRLREDAAELWKKLFVHPFVVEIYEGVLPIEKFKFYVLQDYNYLVTTIKDFSILASKAPSAKALREIIGVAHLEATGQFKSYENLLKRLGYQIEDAEKIETPLISTSYTSFLLATSLLSSFGEGLAAVLPCFWSYAEIAEFHREKLRGNKNTLYLDWASVYFTKPYLELVERLKRLLDSAPIGDYEKLKEKFLLGSKYEYWFWNAAYGKEGSTSKRNF